ncbi:hypothetical protein LZ32DRAFT_381063 [Colletotrichum eremochloae]|nr:hypothetical protein LZ32DRAFT_381063 [Colletotrichum eremochloae]
MPAVPVLVIPSHVCSTPPILFLPPLATTPSPCLATTHRPNAASRSRLDANHTSLTLPSSVFRLDKKLEKPKDGACTSLRTMRVLQAAAFPRPIELPSLIYMRRESIQEAPPPHQQVTRLEKKERATLGNQEGERERERERS